MNKTYKVSKDLKPFVRRVLTRSFYTCRIQTDTAGQIWCHTNASSDAFHRMVQRAKCEKVSKETGIFHVTTKEANNELYLTQLLHDANVTSYQIIDDKDGTRRKRIHH